VYSRRVTTQPPFDFLGTMAHDGPLDRPSALAALDHAAALMGAADYVDAARLYQRVIGFDDPAVTAAALLGLGQALHRIDDENGALGAWEEVTRLPPTPSTYPAWREIAGARVRRGDLAGAADAYREADRITPAQDKAEIAARLGWLSKELGDSKAAGRYFSRARGRGGLSMTVVLIAITTIVSIVGNLGTDGQAVVDALQLDKVAVAAGQLWRLWTVTLVHAPLTEDPFHLVFNMYALWLIGPHVERLYGRARFLAIYLVCALGGSLMSFALGDAQTAVGASGAIFGLFGILVAALYVHRPLLGPGMRGMMGQLVAIIALNILIGITGQGIDNWAHIGGLVTGLWLGVLFIPTDVPSPRSMWLRPGPTPGSAVLAFGQGGTIALRVAGVLALATFFALLWTMGVAAWG
jgi:membrane associated rhomboid family serine protease